MRVRGVTLVDWTANGYSRPSALAAVDEIAGLGASELVIVVTVYQQRTSDNAVRVDLDKTPTPGAVSSVATRAISRGMNVVVKLHVDLDNGDWRGTIGPMDPASWFDSYGAFVGQWADWAVQNGASGLVIGTELAGTLGHEDRWRSLIRMVRSRFDGDVLYAASWDEASMVPFWDAIDRVGVDFYAPVSIRGDAGRVELLTGWQAWIERLHLLHKQTGKAVLLTEIGYRSVDGAGMRPYDFDANSTFDPAEQADLYWAAMQAVGDTDWIEGVYWWNWLAAGGGGAGNKDYTPKDKMAEEELAGAWSH
jgi:hypothetical protein